MPNQFKELQDIILPKTPLMTGTVLSSSSNITRVELPSGAVVIARGAATVGTQVYVKDGEVRGVAPALTTVNISI